MATRTKTVAARINALEAEVEGLRADAGIIRRYALTLEAELTELRKWPTTVEGREAWLQTIIYLLVEGVDDIIMRNPETAPPFADALREYTRKRGNEIAARAARKLNWWERDSEEGVS